MKRGAKHIDLLLATFICLWAMLPLNWIAITCIILFMILIFKKHGEIYKIKYESILLYLFVAGLVLGMINGYYAYDVIRDGLYYLIPIITLYIGAILYTTYSELNPLKIFIEATTIEVIIHLFEIILNFSKITDFYQLRAYFMFLTFSTPVALLVLLDDDLGKKLKLTKKNKMFFLVIIGLYFVLSLSRISYIMLIGILVLDLLLHIIQGTFKFNLIAKAIFIVMVVIVGILMIPVSTRTVFLNKIVNIFNEIKINQNWNVTTITQDWRGYEKFVADQMFSTATLIHKIFGFGFGKLVPVLYSELVGVSATANGITILHDGYRTVLIKSGVIGLSLYIIFLLLLLFKKNKGNFQEKNFILKFIAMELLIGTSVVGGLFSRSPEVALLLLMGIYLKK